MKALLTKAALMVLSVLIIVTPQSSPVRAQRTASAQAPRPNVVLIYADDLGYGDVSSYGAMSLKTPNIDRLAREGLRFTDGHSPAATCTPSRYAMLTGEYAWRKPGTGVLPGDAALVIEPGRTTLPSIFQRAGYTTGVVGKWHLGLGPKGGPDWNGEIKPGPRDVGFNYEFVMAATGDRVPTAYVENRRVVGLDPADPIKVSYAEPVGDWPTGKANPELLKMHPSHGHDQSIVNGVSRIGYMTGGKAALWKDEEMADVFTKKAVSFIEQNKAAPFFLYFALHDPHVPRVPHPRFVGKSGMGPRGDAIVQADWCVGEILAALDKLRLTNNTLVILTSDNGPVVDDGYRDQAVELLGGHKPAGPWRGGKYSNFEAGTRVPFIVKWPGRIKPGVSDALVSQIDFPASFASFLGQKLAAGDAPDSFDVMPAFVGESKTGRAHLVEQAGTLSLRQGHWKYITPSKGQKINRNTNTEMGNDPAPQLYNLSTDPGETNNVAGKHPEKVREMETMLQQIRSAGRSRK
ncbi:MAG: arylsulfatase [Acidobacteriota bacterium]|nr:arylsulfatase [Acidobacteriota bacterium]